MNSHAGGPGFESLRAHHLDSIAYWVPSSRKIGHLLFKQYTTKKRLGFTGFSRSLRRDRIKTVSKPAAKRCLELPFERKQTP